VERKAVADEDPLAEKALFWGRLCGGGGGSTKETICEPIKTKLLNENKRRKNFRAPGIFLEGGPRRERK